MIDDGSTDKTADIAYKAGASVVSLPSNLGIGGAMQTGYLYALRNGYDIAVQMDADGQHRVEELHKILIPLIREEGDLVIGSRFIESKSYKPSISRRCGIFILSCVVSVILRQKIKDVTSGFRAVNRKVIELSAKKYSTDYSEVDSLVLVRQNNLSILEVPVQMSDRLAGRSSITTLKGFYYMVKVALYMVKVALTIIMRRF